ncbi:MAG: sigma-70 family RNA polymerase sigma factor [Acidobacteria bacterium]|nr:sigma-70 family RNA polymerase sigma factor [Acidobacteriota bacterium]
MSGSAPNSSWDDAALVEACLRGQQTAWDALVEKYSRLVYSIPSRYRLPPEEAADVFQNVWLDLYRDLPNLQQAAALRSWLLTATSRRCLLHQRRLRHMASDLEAETEGLRDPSPDPLALQQQAERRHLVDLAMQRLPERCRALVQMLFFEQPPVAYGEAARRLGLAEGSIGFIRGRCLSKLRRQLRELGSE